jgi:hypothetical protein
MSMGFQVLGNEGGVFDKGGEEREHARRSCKINEKYRHYKN